MTLDETSLAPRGRHLKRFHSTVYSKFAQCPVLIQVVNVSENHQSGLKDSRSSEDLSS